MSDPLAGLLGFGTASHEDRGPAMKLFQIFMIIIPTIVILLRFWSTVLIRTRPDFPLFWWDDWLALLSLVSDFCRASYPVLEDLLRIL